MDRFKKWHGFPSELTPAEHSHPLLEGFLRLPMVVLSMIRGTCEGSFCVTFRAFTNMIATYFLNLTLMGMELDTLSPHMLYCLTNTYAQSYGWR